MYQDNGHLLSSITHFGAKHVIFEFRECDLSQPVVLPVGGGAPQQGLTFTRLDTFPEFEICEVSRALQTY